MTLAHSSNARSNLMRSSRVRLKLQTLYRSYRPVSRYAISTLSTTLSRTRNCAFQCCVSAHGHSAGGVSWCWPVPATGGSVLSREGAHYAPARE